MQQRNAIIILLLLLSGTAVSQPAEKILLSTDKQWYYISETVWLSINTLNACTDSIQQMSSVAYIELVGMDAKPVVKAKLKIESGKGVGQFTINEDVTSGDYLLYAYTNWMKNFGQESYAQKVVHIVNPAKPGKFNTALSKPIGNAISQWSTNVQVNKSSYQKREKVLANFSGLPSANIIVSVHKVDELEKGAAETYMSQVPAPCKGQLNSSLSFAWEKRGHHVTARVTNKQSHVPAAGITGYLTILNSPDELFVATSDSSGLITFIVGEVIGPNELVLQVDEGGAEKYNIEIVNANTITGRSELPAGNDNSFGEMSESMDDALVSAQVQKVFANKNKVSAAHASAAVYPFYGKADAFYLMSDYVHFSTVEEILREYVTTVGVQKRDGKLYPIVNDILSKKPFPDVPLILVNGVPIFDMQRFMSLNTDEFHSIAVLARKYFIGEKMFYGIIDVRLNVPLKEFGATAQVVDYMGTLPAFEITQPDYQDELQRRSRKPDFRNVLYWNPGTVTNKEGKAAVEFYTGDLEGEYAIVVTMVAPDGKIGTANSRFKVQD
jgi:hypothetical protein